MNINTETMKDITRFVEAWIPSTFSLRNEPVIGFVYDGSQVVSVQFPAASAKLVNGFRLNGDAFCCCIINVGSNEIVIRS